VFIESIDGRGGCMTFQFNRGPQQQGVELFEMILSELNDGATVQVSRDDFLSFHFNLKQKLNNYFFDTFSGDRLPISRTRRQPLPVLHQMEQPGSWPQQTRCLKQKMKLS
jgi:hypothetical protein